MNFSCNTLYATIILLICTAITPVYAQVYTIDSVPNPRVQYGGFVTDPDNVLGTQAARINARLVEFERTTTNEIAIVILPSIDTEDLDDFAVSLFNKWGVGKKDANNGLLLLFVMDQRRWRFATGYGFEVIYSDTFLDQVGYEVMRPLLKEQRFADAISAALDALMLRLDEVATKNPVASENTKKTLWYSVRNKFDAIFGKWNRPLVQEEHTREILPGFGIALTIAYVVIAAFVFAARYYSRKKRRRKSAQFTLQTFVYYSFVPILIWTIVLSEATPGAVIIVYLLISVFVAYFRWQKVAHRGKSRFDPYTQLQRLNEDHGPGFYFYVLVFPFVGIPFLIYYLWKRNYLRYLPRSCPKCKIPMAMLNEAADDTFLTEGKRMEEYIGSVNYDVWNCQGCNGIKIERYETFFTSYSSCPKCSHKTLHTLSDRTIDSPSCYSSGLGERHKACKFCHHDYRETYEIPRRNCDSDSSSSSSSSSSSFGGGSSGGSGSGGGW